MSISAEIKETADEKWTTLYSSVEVEGRAFFFSPPLPVVFLKDGKFWTASIPDFNIAVVSTSPDGAVHSFGIEILSLWDHIAAEDDNKLTTDARLLKQNLLGRIKESNRRV